MLLAILDSTRLKTPEDNDTKNQLSLFKSKFTSLGVCVTWNSHRYTSIISPGVVDRLPIPQSWQHFRQLVDQVWAASLCGPPNTLDAFYSPFHSWVSLKGLQVWLFSRCCQKGPTIIFPFNNSWTEPKQKRI